MIDLKESLARKKSLYADLSLLLVAFFWGAGFIVIKDALDYITPLYMNGIRFTLASILMSLVFFKKLKKITRQDLIYGSIVGVFLFCGFSIQTIGLQYTTASKQAFLTGTNVVIVPFLAWIIHKKHPGIHAMVGAVLTVVGIGLLTLRGIDVSIGFGDMLTLISAVFYAAHITSVGYFAPKMDTIIFALIQIGTAAVLHILSAIIFEPVPTEIDRRIILSIGYLVICSTIGSLIIQSTAQKFTSSTRAAIILSLESVIGALLAVFILGDKLSLSMIVGCILIFIAIIITETKVSFPFFQRKNELRGENTDCS